MATREPCSEGGQGRTLFSPCRSPKMSYLDLATIIATICTWGKVESRTGERRVRSAFGSGFDPQSRASVLARHPCRASAHDISHHRESSQQASGDARPTKAAWTATLFRPHPEGGKLHDGGKDCRREGDFSSVGGAAMDGFCWADGSDVGCRGVVPELSRPRCGFRRGAAGGKGPVRGTIARESRPATLSLSPLHRKEMFIMRRLYSL